MFKKKKKSDDILCQPPSFGTQAKEFVFELFKVILISLAIIIPVRYFLIQPFYVKGASMEPNYYDHEYLIINEISYRFNDPERGDVVVFKYPRDTKQFFIKRVIGLPGETIEIKSGQVYIYNDEYPTGVQLDEDLYLEDNIRTSGEKVVLLRNEEYYVLGDNRSSSLDSRNFGPLPRNMVVGKVLLRGWPFDRVGLFEPPEYGL